MSKFPAQENELWQQKPVLAEYLGQRPRQLSSLSFVNVFLWKDFFQFKFEKLGSQLCVFATHDVGTFMYLPPLGWDFDLSVAQSCFEYMQSKNHGQGVSRIENVTKEELAIFPEDQFSFFHKGDEYVYSRQDLINLHGGEYKSKRHDGNLFKKHYSAQVLPFSTKMRDECVGLYDRWAQNRKQTHADPVYLAMLEDNRGVHALGMEFFQELGLVGRVVVVDGKIVAYTFGYALDEKTFCVLFEVADLALLGLPVFIFREFCADPELAPFTWINVMDDFGVPNLERTKSSFRPAKRVAAYTVSRKVCVGSR